MPWKGGGPAESPAQSTIAASRPRAKMANGDSSRIHRYLRLPPHKAKFLSQMKGVGTDSRVACGGGNQRQVGEIGAIPLRVARKKGQSGDDRMGTDEEVGQHTCAKAAG